MLIMIEVLYYEINSKSHVLLEQIFAKHDSKDAFWADATRYAASKNNDESFVSEIAYMMVTLHRTGA